MAESKRKVDRCDVRDAIKRRRRQIKGKVIELYNSGETISDIAKDLFITEIAVYSILKEEGHLS